MIVKPELAHRFGIEQIAPVKHDRRRHFFFHHGKIDIGEFAPLRRNDQRFSATHRFKRRYCEFRLCDGFDFARLCHSFWIVSGDVCALAQKIGHQIDGDR